MRRRIVAAEAEILRLVPEDFEKFERSFGGVTSRKSLFVIVPFILISSPVYALSFPFFGVYSLIVTLASGVIFGLSLATMIWVYFNSVVGFYRFGKNSPSLVPYYKDMTLGMKPLGSLSLSLAYVYFVGLAILMINTLAYAGYQTPEVVVGSEALVVFMFGVGVVAFFLPLISLHGVMIGHKAQELATLRSDYAELLSARESFLPDSSAVANLWHLGTLNAKEKLISGIRTWPFDTGILGRFAAVVISILTTIVGRILILYLLQI